MKVRQIIHLVTTPLQLLWRLFQKIPFGDGEINQPIAQKNHLNQFWITGTCVAHVWWQNTQVQDDRVSVRFTCYFINSHLRLTSHSSIGYIQRVSTCWSKSVKYLNFEFPRWSFFLCLHWFIYLFFFLCLSIHEYTALCGININLWTELSWIEMNSTELG